MLYGFVLIIVLALMVAILGLWTTLGLAALVIIGRVLYLLYED